MIKIKKGTVITKDGRIRRYENPKEIKQIQVHKCIYDTEKDLIQKIKISKSKRDKRHYMKLLWAMRKRKKRDEIEQKELLEKKMMVDLYGKDKKR